MQRRHFVQQSALSAAALMCAPLMDKDPVLGQAQKRYRLDTQWSRADATRYPVKDCHEMVQDSKGNILLLTNDTHNNVIVYSKKGRVLKTWGTSYPGAHGLTLFNENGTDVLFICDNSRHQVIKTTIDGRELLVLDYPRESGLYAKAEEYIPTETAIAANGDIYVADGYGKDFIHQYDAGGRYVKSFGGRGAEKSNLLNAHGVCFDTRGGGKPTLVVTSRQENAFKRYDTDGNYLETIALPGAWVCRPVIRGDYLYAAVLQSNNRQGKSSGFVTILDKDNKVVSNLGGTAPVYSNDQLQEMEQSTPNFIYPHDVCIDDDECIYVAQWNSNQLYPFKLSPVI